MLNLLVYFCYDIIYFFYKLLIEGINSNKENNHIDFICELEFIAISNTVILTNPFPEWPVSSTSSGLLKLLFPLNKLPS